MTDQVLTNQPPHTFLSLFPDSGITQQQSRIRVHWWGDDPDGLIVGYFVTWDNIHWAFTTKNDSTFALMIGASDTSYLFRVAAADNSGNGQYDNAVVQNNTNFGPEPFIDQNGDGKYNPGEKFFDIGMVDPNPAGLKYPIKNSAPQLGFNSLTVLPDTSFPVMTLGWNAEDLDGNESIVKINIAANDTTKFISLPGNTRLIMLRIKDFNAQNPQAEILLNASDKSIFQQKLPGLILNGSNRIYIQAEDISGAKSPFSMLPAGSKPWYIKKPAGQVLIIDDNKANDDAAAFYRKNFDAMKNGSFKGQYDVWDLKQNKVPYESVTFLETLKLFKYVLWYSDNNPNLALASQTSRNYIDFGGKIAFSMMFTNPVDVTLLRSFLPVDSVGTVNKRDFANFLSGGTNIVPNLEGYPSLKIRSDLSISQARSFYPTEGSTTAVYSLQTTQFSGNKIIAFRDSDKKLFFIGLPLHKMDSSQDNVKQLLEKIFFEDFGLTL